MAGCDTLSVHLLYGARILTSEARTAHLQSQVPSDHIKAWNTKELRTRLPSDSCIAFFLQDTCLEEGPHHTVFALKNRPLDAEWGRGYIEDNRVRERNQAMGMQELPAADADLTRGA